MALACGSMPASKPSTGGGSLPGRPVRRLTKACCSEVNSSLRLLVGVGGEDVEAEHDIGLVQLLGRLEARAVDVERMLHLGRREMRGEGVGQAEHGGKLRANRLEPRIQSGTLQAFAGHGADALAWLGRRK